MRLHTGRGGIMKEYTDEEIETYVQEHITGYGIDSEIARRYIELKKDLFLNSSLLARQTDLARVAESDLLLEAAYHEATKRSLFASNSMILDLEKKAAPLLDETAAYVKGHITGFMEAEEHYKAKKVAPLLDVCKWLLFHAENGRRWKTVAHRGLDFTEDEFEGRLRAVIAIAGGDV